MKLLLPLLAAGMLAGCGRNAYEEELFLNADGSGEIRIRGMQEIVFSLNGLGALSNSLSASLGVFRGGFDSSELRVLEVGHSTHAGRSYLHLRARFDDLNQLAVHPVLSDRTFHFDDSREHLELTADIQRGLGSRTDRAKLPGEGWMVFRAHFPSPIHSHNSSSGIERGNNITWKESLAEFDREGVLHLEARFSRRTVFEETIFLLGASMALVILLVTGAVFVIYRKGRRQLAS